MNNIQRLPVDARRVIAVLLPDGWHHVVPGSFTVGPLGFGVDDDRLGFRFDEDNSAADEPTSLTGSLDTLLAVRQSRARSSLSSISRSACAVVPAEPARSARA
ncbi:hypothetical protein ACFWUU_38225 [Kribbella sp. NPDC058693]|uniref:hypothetical protein n=1 Tax=Kribbella sp. NPDC058693 TaxID=3346602 RepID=UPI00364DA113